MVAAISKFVTVAALIDDVTEGVQVFSEQQEGPQPH